MHLSYRLSLCDHGLSSVLKLEPHVSKGVGRGRIACRVFNRICKRTPEVRTQRVEPCDGTSRGLSSFTGRVLEFASSRETRYATWRDPTAPCDSLSLSFTRASPPRRTCLSHSPLRVPPNSLQVTGELFGHPPLLSPPFSNAPTPQKWPPFPRNPATSSCRSTTRTPSTSTTSARPFPRGAAGLSRPASVFFSGWGEAFRKLKMSLTAPDPPKSWIRCPSIRRNPF